MSQYDKVLRKIRTFFKFLKGVCPETNLYIHFISDIGIALVGTYTKLELHHGTGWKTVGERVKVRRSSRCVSFKVICFLFMKKDKVT